MFLCIYLRGKVVSDDVASINVRFWLVLGFYLIKLYE